LLQTTARLRLERGDARQRINDLLGEVEKERESKIEAENVSAGLAVQGRSALGKDPDPGGRDGPAARGGVQTLGVSERWDSGVTPLVLLAYLAHD
jgi:hypothetical protein